MAEYQPGSLAGCLPPQGKGLPEYEAITSEAKAGEMETIANNQAAGSSSACIPYRPHLFPLPINPLLLPYLCF